MTIDLMTIEEDSDEGGHLNVDEKWELVLLVVDLKLLWLRREERRCSLKVEKGQDSNRGYLVSSGIVRT